MNIQTKSSITSPKYSNTEITWQSQTLHTSGLSSAVNRNHQSCDNPKPDYLYEITLRPPPAMVKSDTFHLWEKQISSPKSNIKEQKTLLQEVLSKSTVSENDIHRKNPVTIKEPVRRKLSDDTQSVSSSHDPRTQTSTHQGRKSKLKPIYPKKKLGGKKKKTVSFAELPDNVSRDLENGRASNRGPMLPIQEKYHKGLPIRSISSGNLGIKTSDLNQNYIVNRSDSFPNSKSFSVPQNILNRASSSVLNSDFPNKQVKSGKKNLLHYLKK